MSAAIATSPAVSPPAVAPLPATFEGWRQTGYGDVDQLVRSPRAMPVPGDGEVLVQLTASSVTSGDLVLLKGRPFLLRLMFGLRRPAMVGSGMDVAGVVARVGPGVTRVQPGDAVFGQAEGGAHAPYVVVDAQHVARVPEGVDPVDVASIPVAGLTALQALTTHADVQPGQHVLVFGASGAVGSFIVQLAHAMGARVTAVASARNAERLRALGADHVVDYTTTDVTAGDVVYDAILDFIGDQPLSALRRILSPTGAYVCGAGQGGDWLGPVPRLLTVAVANLFTTQRLVGMVGTPNAADLDRLAALLADGALRPVVDGRFDLAQLPDAFRRQAEGHAQGRRLVVA
ncbi:MAG: NAD(P)-dependent alcohol dehydrogenase [Alphaproteobacteria bacterium]|nr:NAD(P)-dependent alcohol dehydrogenase [Alphaproteobacteria bacterium]